MKTHPLAQRLVELSKVMRWKTIGKLETNEQTTGVGESEIEKGVGSRNQRSMAKPDVGNPTTNLGAIPGGYRFGFW